MSPTQPTLFENKIFRDHRGFFTERYVEPRYNEWGLNVKFVQDNHSRSIPKVVRGLHYQHSPGQGKLVGVTRGRIWDVAVDLRVGSPTFGKWEAFELSDENGKVLWIPGGFAHGFCVLGDEPADVLYKVDCPYNGPNEGGIRFDDPDLGVAWPIQDPVFSERDRQMQSLQDYLKNPVFRFE